MVRIGDRVHVKDEGYGQIVEHAPHLNAPYLVALDDGEQKWAYESHISVLRPPDLGPIDDYQRTLSLKTLEVLVRGFEDYARHKFFECIEDDPGVCRCGYSRTKAQVADIKKLVGL